LNLVGTVRFTARVAIDPNKGAVGVAAADGKAVAEAGAAGAAAAIATGIAGDTEELASHTGMCH
jgi:hypothetical protein